jgi:hypothetical protein
MVSNTPQWRGAAHPFCSGSSQAKYYYPAYRIGPHAAVARLIRVGLAMKGGVHLMVAMFFTRRLSSSA